MMEDTEESTTKVEEETSSPLKNSPSKKEQSVKEQLEQDWAEDDSREGDNKEVDSNQEDVLEQVNVVPNVESHSTEPELDLGNKEAIAELDLDTPIDTTIIPSGDPTPTGDSDNLSKEPDSSSLVSFNSLEVPNSNATTTNHVDLSTGIETAFNNPLDAALDAIDSNTEATFENIIDSAFASASASAAPSMPTISAVESESISEQPTPDTATDPIPDAEEEDKDAAKETTANKSTDESDKEKNEEGDSGARKMRMHLTSQMMQKLLKEGNMEKLPNGSYKIKAEALKELQNNMPRDNDEEDEDDDDDDDDEQDDDDEEEEDIDEDEEDAEEEFQSSGPTPSEKNEEPRDKREENIEDEMMETDNNITESNKATEDENEVPVETTHDRKRSASPTPPAIKKKKLTKYNQDYVSDYNSSEDDDESPFTVLRENIKSMLPKRGKYQKKGMSFLEEVHKNLFEEDNLTDSLSDLSDSDMEPMKDDLKSKTNGPDTTKKLCPGTTSIEAKLGVDGGTTLKVIATGEVKEVQGKEFEVYNLCTTTDGSSTATTPLMIPKSNTSSISPKKKQNGAILLYHKPHVKLEPDDPNTVEEIEDKRIKLRKYKQQIKLLRLRYLQLVQERMSKPGFNTLADLVNAASRFMTDEQLLFTTMQLKSGCLNTKGIRWSPREKILALGIYLQNTSQYDMLRQMFHLPHKNILDKWLDCIAKNNPIHAKKLMYHVYTKYTYKALG